MSVAGLGRLRVQNGSKCGAVVKSNGRKVMDLLKLLRKEESKLLTVVGKA